MDTTTIVIGLDLAETAIQTVQQYSNGTITQEQAHQQLVDAASSLNSAIDAFNAAKTPTN